MIFQRIKKLWALSNLDSAHLQDLLERAIEDASLHREIPISGDGNKKNYQVDDRQAKFIPRIKRDPIKELIEAEKQ